VVATVITVTRALSRPYPGALTGAVLGVMLVTMLAAGWFRALRRVAPAAAGPAV